MSGEPCFSGGCGWLLVEPFAQNVEVDAEASEHRRGLLVASERAQQVAQAVPCALLVERDPGACHQHPLRHRIGEKRVEHRRNLALGTQRERANEPELGAYARRTAAGERDRFLTSIGSCPDLHRAHAGFGTRRLRLGA